MLTPLQQAPWLPPTGRPHIVSVRGVLWHRCLRQDNPENSVFTGLYLPPGIVGTCPVCPPFLPRSFVIPALVVEIWLGRSLSLYRRFCAPAAVGHYSTARTRTVQRFGYSHPLLAGPRDSVVLSGSAGGCVPGRDRWSTLLSVDIGRSLRLGMQLLPAVLLFFLVTEHFDGPRDIRLHPHVLHAGNRTCLQNAMGCLARQWHHQSSGHTSWNPSPRGPQRSDVLGDYCAAIILYFLRSTPSLCHHCWALHLPEPMCCVRFQESDSRTDHDNFSDLYHASYAAQASSGHWTRSSARPASLGTPSQCPLLSQCSAC